eukprot:TRINITY_DN20564_c0_g1_i1.p1 TRINITY_DN20564_c0_g1~~TRINITY_DN20564_c0_g1_i1.p1  ORF type:complete len:170 (+),score=3.85 TRINITY_DN20564_c0_g1_i1:157-666(+)
MSEPDRRRRQTHQTRSVQLCATACTLNTPVIHQCSFMGKFSHYRLLPIASLSFRRSSICLRSASFLSALTRISSSAFAPRPDLGSGLRADCGRLMLTGPRIRFRPLMALPGVAALNLAFPATGGEISGLSAKRKLCMPPLRARRVWWFSSWLGLGAGWSHQTTRSTLES